jgi:GMP synthase-like glutamine amidotransferase
MSESGGNVEKILILDNSIDQKIYCPVDHWKPYLSYPYDSVRSSEGEFPNELENYSHIIVTGSEASVHEDYEWILNQEKLIRRAVDMNKVVLGSCFGHQLVARALFGKDVLVRRECPEVGWINVKVLTDDPPLGRRNQGIDCFAIHYDQVENLPKDAVEVLATSEGCPVQAFKLKNKPVWGIQPHPEIDIEMGEETLKRMAKKDETNRKHFTDAARGAPKDSGWIKPLMREFQLQ